MSETITEHGVAEEPDRADKCGNPLIHEAV